MKRLILIFLFTLTSSASLFAQAYKNFSARYTDSLRAERDNNFLYNNLRIFNRGFDSLPVHISVKCPPGWKLLSPDTLADIIAPRDTFVLSVTICKKADASAQWQPFNVLVYFGGHKIADTLRFYVQAEAFSAFKVKSEDIVIDPNHKRTIISQFRIKNFGNVDARYHLLLTNEGLLLKHKDVIELPPGGDTTFTYSYKVPATAWKIYNNGDMHFSVADSLFLKKDNSQVGHGVQRLITNKYNITNPYFETINFIRQDSSVREHPSAYPQLALNLETGYLSYDGASAYYGAVSGAMPIGKTSKLTFDYHSRQFGLNNYIAQNIYNVAFESHHWNFHLGQVSDGRYFRTFGTGLSAGYYWGKNLFGQSSITLFGVKHLDGFYTTNDNGGMLLRLQMGRVKWANSLFVNTDSGGKLNSYLFSTDLSLITKSSMELSANGGVGIVQSQLANTNIPELQIGYFGGYRFRYIKSKLAIASSAYYYDGNFPGFNRGSINASQSIKFKNRRTSYEAYYTYDVRANNYFQDTIYNSDVLKNNIQKYGVRYGLDFLRTGFLLGVGIIRQEGAIYSFAPNYEFGDLQFFHRARRHFSLGLSGLCGYAPIGNDPAILATASLNISYRFFGIAGGYSHVPVIVTDNGDQKISTNTETVYGGPFASFRVLKYLSVTTQYNVSKTLYGDGLSSFANISLLYENPRNGIRLSINGSSPLQRPDASSIDPLKYGYLTASLRKSFNVPVIFKRKYYYLNTRVYADENGNGILDYNVEHPIPNLPLTVNDKHFITDRNGMIRYKNIEPGNYDIDLNGSSIKGYIPGKGYVQTVSVRKNKRVDIAFKKSCIISGRVEILQDSNSLTYFSPAKIKITAVDSSQQSYSAITNSTGDYFISLPAGKYLVSLNPEAFNQMYRPVEYTINVNVNESQSGIANFQVKQQKRTMKILKMESEVTAEPTKAEKPKVGFVPFTKEELESERKAQARSNYYDLVPLEKDTAALKYMEKSKRIKARNGLSFSIQEDDKKNKQDSVSKKSGNLSKKQHEGKDKGTNTINKPTIVSDKNKPNVQKISDAASTANTTADTMSKKLDQQIFRPVDPATEPIKSGDKASSDRGKKKPKSTYLYTTP